MDQPLTSESFSACTWSVQVANEVVGERDDALHSMAQLGVVEMVQQVAHLQLGALGHLHGEQALAVLILTL